MALEHTQNTPEVMVEHCPRDEAAEKLLDLFFRIHYVVGMKVEDTLRTNDILNRHQVAVLWTIRSEGIEGLSMRRKYIENTMTGWYDISSSAISKAIRALAKSPLELITIEEHPKSAREKLITLTPRGQKFVHGMVKNGTSMCRWFLDNMSKYDAERDICLYIYSKTNAIFNRMIDQERIELGELHEDPQKSNQLLQHPLAAGFLERSYGFEEIPRVPREYSALMQLDIFFPIHYKAGNRVEAALRKGASLNRQQVIILWAIAAQGVDGEKMERKLIEQTLKDWLEITSSSVSKAIRSLTDPPLNILTITENPASGREKIVCLTEEGKRVVQDMLSNGKDYLQDLIAELSDEEINMVISIFARTHEIFKIYPGPFREEQPLKDAAV